MRLDDATYAAEVAALFKRLVKAIDAADPDAIECDATPDMVTITALPAGTKVIVNTQRAVKQIWVAGQGMGVHFQREPDGVWRDDKQAGHELMRWVGQCVEAASGVVLHGL